MQAIRRTGRPGSAYWFPLQLYCGARPYCAASRNDLGRDPSVWGRIWRLAMSDAATPSLDEVRKRIDAIDADLLRLVVERASLAKSVAMAKAAAGDAGKFGLRPGRETALLKKLLAGPRTTKDMGNGARLGLIVRIWRELIGDSLATQGPFHIAVWGGKDPGRAVEVARLRFGVAPSLRQVAKPEDAIAEAKSLGGGAGVCALTLDSAWWGRLLAEPKLKVLRGAPLPRRLGPARGARRRRGRDRAHRRRQHLLGHRRGPTVQGHRRCAQPRRRRRHPDGRAWRPEALPALRLLPVRRPAPRPRAGQARRRHRRRAPAAGRSSASA